MCFDAGAEKTPGSRRRQVSRLEYSTIADESLPVRPTHHLQGSSIVLRHFVQAPPLYTARVLVLKADRNRLDRNLKEFHSLSPLS
jgi:hypothetical protein